MKDFGERAIWKDLVIKSILAVMGFGLLNLWFSSAITDDMAVAGLRVYGYTDITLSDRHAWFVPYFRGGSRNDQVVYTAAVTRPDGRRDTVRVYITALAQKVSVRKN